jgi:two-component system response regulator YesN
MKLLIADDDRQIVEGIKEGIDWKSLGIDEVLPAFNGIEAFELFQSRLPEMVITDIRMPGMDGLELLRRMKERMPAVKTAIISGYSDFEYLKKAIQFGTVDYELKPVKVRSLIQLIRKMKDDIIKEKVSEENYNKYLESHKEKFISELLDGRMSDRNIILEGLRQYYDFDGRGTLLCAVMEIDHYRAGYVRNEKCAGEKPEAFVMEYIRGCGLSRSETLFLKTDENIFTFIFRTVDSALYMNRLKDDLANRTACLNSELEKQTGLTVSAGISSAGTVNDIPAIYRQAIAALKGKLYSGTRSVNYPVEPAVQEKNYFVSAITEEYVRSHMQNLDFDAVLSSIRNDFETIARERCCNKSGIANFCMFLVNILIPAMRESSSDFEEYINSRMDGIGNISSFETIGEYREFVLGLYKEAFLRYSDSKKSRRSMAVQKAMDYIAKNYNTDLTVEILARRAGKTPNYFSHIFKKELGISFTEYVNKIRIEKAKELILHSNLLIYEIGERVGYRDYVYFTQIFKKNEGYPPTELRKGNV